MPLTSELIPWRIKTIPGMNTKMENFELQSNWVERAQNCRFEEEIGSVRKRDPISYFNGVSDKIGTDPMMGLYRYYTSTGTTKFIGVSGTGVYVGADATGVFTSIRTLSNSGKRCTFLTYDDLLMGFNGYDNPFVYDGSSDNVTWELGSCKAVTAAGGTNLVAEATYSYKITYDADTIVNGAVSNTVTTGSAGGNRKVALSNIPLGPVGSTNRKIYRTEGGGTAYYLIATISDKTTTYTDDIADTTATAYPAVNNDIPTGNIPILFRERLFLAGNQNNPNSVYYSYPYLPHIILQTTGADVLLVSPDDNDEIVGLAVHMGIMTCIKKNNLRKLYVSGPDTSWYAEDPLFFVGSPAPWSVTNTSRGIVFLGWDHWYLFDGANVSAIIDEFDTAEILAGRYAETVSYFHQDHLIAAYTDATIGTQYHNRVMRFNLKRQKLSYDTINANCFAAKRGDDEGGELYYGSSIEGYVYKGSNEELIYRLNSKTDVKAGTSSGTYIGGTESTPYVEIGSTTTASALPTNTCMFWDQETDPDSGWTEIISYNDRYIRIGTSITTGIVSGSTVPIASQEPELITYINLRLFYFNGSTSATNFPVGAIIFFDQPTPPTGYISLNANYYIKISQDDVNTTGTDYICSSTGTTGLVSLDSVRSLHCIKRVGEVDTWDGTSQYCYTFSNGAISTNGWTNVSSTYASYFIKTGTAPVTTVGGDTTYGMSILSNSNITHSYSNVDGTVTGDSYSTYDDTESTWLQNYIQHSGDGSTECSLTSEHTWTDAVKVTRLYAKEGQNTYGGNYKESWRTYYTYLCISGSWTLIQNDVTHDYSVGSNSEYAEDKTYDSSVGWDVVTGVRTYLYGKAYSYEGDRQQYVTLKIYEMEVWAEACKYVTFPFAKKILGQCEDYNAAITTPATSGTWTSPSIQINATAVNKLYWNESVTTGDDIHLHFRTGATKVVCEAGGNAFSSAIDNPNGILLSSYVNANLWIQYRVDFSCVNSTVTNPRLYLADGFLVKFLYGKSAVLAETAVEFRYALGYRNFDMPMIDKIHKKIGTVHEGIEGNFNLIWETENADNEFVVSLTDNTERWSSFFQDTAMGEKLNIEVYKNDLYNFTLKEINGIFAPEPLII